MKDEERKYISKVFDGIEIRFYTDESSGYITGRIFKENNPVGIKYRNGDIIHMESDNNKTSILKKLKGAIYAFNSGKAEIVDVPELAGAKFTTGDIIVEKETNVVELSDVYIILESDTYKPTYKGFGIENDDIKKYDLSRDIIDNTYVSIGNDKGIIDWYIMIQADMDHINECKQKIKNNLETSLNILNKTNDEFYVDLVKQIYTSDKTEYEKEKYIEFLSAAYNNYQKK